MTYNRKYSYNDLYLRNNAVNIRIMKYSLYLRNNAVNIRIMTYIVVIMP